MKTRQPEEERIASLGDCAVAVASFIAIVITGFFGAEPELPAAPPTHLAQSAQR